MYTMKLEQFQVNTKFLNTLPSEWSKFVTDVKLVRDLHTTNVNQLHAYLGQHEYHANEVRLMNERTSDLLALISKHQLNRTPYQHHQPLYQQSQFQPQATSYQSSPYATTYHNSQLVSPGPSSLTHSISYPGTDTSSLVNHNAYMASSSAPQIDYAQMDQQLLEYPPPEARLVVPIFQKGDDPIYAINHMMSFLTSVVASRYPVTNNHLRTSSNPRQQATINNGRVTIQPIQGRQNFVSAGSSRPFTSGQRGAPGKQRSQFEQQATSYQSSPYATTYHNSQFVSPGPSSLTHSISYPVTDTSALVNHNAYMTSSSAPQIAYAPMVQQSSEYSPPEAGLVVPVFQKGDNPIDAINHMMLFLTSVVASRYPATNNQLRTSSNPRQQVTINNGRVTIQPIQRRHNFVSAGSSRQFTSGQGGAPGKQRVITCYNCKGEGHMSKQCIKPRRKRGSVSIMPSSIILVPTDSTEESVRSSTSLIILSDSDYEAPPLPIHHVVVDPESDPSKAEAIVLSCSASSPTSSIQIATPPLLIVLVSPVLPRQPAILVLPGQEIPFGRPYRTCSNGVRMLLTTRKRVHPLPARILANRRRSRYVSPLSLSPHKRRRVSLYSSSSSSGTLHPSFETFFASDTPTSVGPSRKRCMSYATSLSATTLSPIALAPVRADYLPPRNRFRDSSAPSHEEVSIEASIKGGIEVTIKDVVEPDVSPFLLEHTVTERSDKEDMEIDLLTEEPLDTFLMGNIEIEFNLLEDIYDLVPIPMVSEEPFFTSIDNPLFIYNSDYALNFENLIFECEYKEMCDDEHFTFDTITLSRGIHTFSEILLILPSTLNSKCWV
nr:hypothetical protein [Tanacetum cinerariifolium]